VEIFNSSILPDMKQIFLLCLTLFILNSVFAQAKYRRYHSSNQNQQKTNLQIDVNKVAIFNLNSAPWLRERFDNPKPYILNNTDIGIINKIFKGCVLKNYIDTNYFHYKKQYVPFIDKEGNRKVWINCFCEDSHIDYWKKNIVFVDDGGRCFFNLIINITDETFSNLIINGYG
jgi:hypothetical protein